MREFPQSILVLGQGVTGKSVAMWLQHHHIAHTLSNPEDVNTDELHRFDCVVISPGIPSQTPLVQLIRHMNIPLLTDFDLFIKHVRGPQQTLLGITGTNGKSTTTALLHHIIKAFQKDTFIGGNIGVPVLDLPNKSLGIYALELSSYQLDYMTSSLTLNAAALLNMTPDHLDRHKTMDQYLQAKIKIFSCCQKGFICIDDIYTRKAYDMLKDQQHIIALSSNGEAHADYSINTLGDIFIKNKKCGNLSNASLKGPHNQQNMLVAFAIAHQEGYAIDDILYHISTFHGLPHRLEKVTTINHVTFVNDSKATNADSTTKAIMALLGQDMYIILGGRAKSDGIMPLIPYFQYFKKAYLIGDAATDFAHTLSGHNVPFTQSGTLHQAVWDAYQDASDNKKGGIVLLSPACASFDQFKNFEARGDAFKTEVLNLPEPQENA